MVTFLALMALILIWCDIDIVRDLAIEKTAYFTLFCTFLGTLLVLMGIVLRIWSGLYIGGHKNVSLVSSGPYRLIRNPLYAGNMISALGVMTLAQSPAATLVLVAGIAVVYRITITHEENHLLSLFEDNYALYRSKVPRFVPRRHAVSTLLRSGSEQTENISYKNLSRELGRGSVFIATAMMVLIFAHSTI